ncbi:hypothetical protein P0D88_34570 [Paraburkholderia sp. RL18-103-BIB-C]
MSSLRPRNVRATPEWTRDEARVFNMATPDALFQGRYPECLRSG